MNYKDGFLNFLLACVLLLNNSLLAFSQDSNDVDKEAEEFGIGVLKGHISKVPGGTKLRIIVESPLYEETSKIDDEFSAKTAEDVVIDGNVIVPIGSTVVGKITEINFAKRLHKSGSVRIEFNSLTTPDGRQVPIVASVLTRSGLLKGRYTPKRALIATSTLVGPAIAGFGAGLAAEGSAVGAGIGATLGAIAGIALFAFQRGNKVDIKAGDELNIELTEDVLVPSKRLEEAQSEKSEPESKAENEPEEEATEKDFTESDSNIGNEINSNSDIDTSVPDVKPEEIPGLETESKKEESN